MLFNNDIYTHGNAMTFMSSHYINNMGFFHSLKSFNGEITRTYKSRTIIQGLFISRLIRGMKNSSLALSLLVQKRAPF